MNLMRSKISKFGNEMGNSESHTSHNIKSWNLSDLFQGENGVIEALRQGASFTDPNEFIRVLLTLQWPSGLQSTINREMFSAILDNEIFSPIVRHNLRVGGIPRLLQAISCILQVTGRRTWDEVMIQTTAEVFMWEKGHGECATDIDTMFALAQFTFLLLVFLTKQLPLKECLLHMEYSPIPELLMRDPLSSGDSPKAALASRGTNDDFLMLLGIPNSILRSSLERPAGTENRLENSPALDPMINEPGGWSTFCVHLSLKDVGRVALPDRRIQFVTPIK
eukprot:Gregarina_sp_Poly_1__2318@NODE_161_length_12274_cov_73_089211_g143_i0_p6_GENE_NODE_161_length_12274_cov_73_089211_g143_i0NODE_161_length_12274_cov_73_089211_g143_i0_p6_ORF_typecomplete_len279_score39_78_NODE_161_length_12274_cov_73_089211_g143_i047655601